MAAGEAERGAAVPACGAGHMTAGDPVGAMHPQAASAVELGDRIDEAHQHQGGARRGDRFHIVVGGLEVDEVAAELFGQAVEEARPRRGSRAHSIHGHCVRTGGTASGRRAAKFEDGDDAEPDHQHQHRHREIDRRYGDRVGVARPEERLGGEHHARAGGGGDRGGGGRHHDPPPYRNAADEDERQHHEAPADQPVAAHRHHPVADAAGGPERIIGAEGADEGEERHQTDEGDSLTGQRPAQFAKRER